MPRIKIEDLPVRQELNDDERKSVFGGHTDIINVAFCDGSVRSLSDSLSSTIDASGNTVYVGGANGGVWKTTNF